MDLIKRLFGGGAKPDLATPSQMDGRPESTAIEVDSQATKRRELVRVLTRDTLRATGIPESWVESHILMELSHGGQPFIHLRLVVRMWDERLLKYAVAFQRRLLDEIAQFEPNVREWLLSITWQYEVGDACPYLDMPEPAVWARAPVRAPLLDPAPECCGSDAQQFGGLLRSVRLTRCCQLVLQKTPRSPIGVRYFRSRKPD